MTVYEDSYDDDSASIATCCMCYTDCALTHLSDGLCPACISLCLSDPALNNDAPLRRVHLVTLTRRAFVLWGDAVQLHAERMSAFRPSASCVEESAALVKHRLRRYALLEARLAKETELDAANVLGDISRNAPRLLSCAL